MNTLHTQPLLRSLWQRLRTWMGAQDERMPKVSGRRSLWAALMALVVAVLVTL